MGIPSEAAMPRSWSVSEVLRKVGARALSLSRLFPPHRPRPLVGSMPHYRRRVLFEMLEQRVLLSGDPLGAVSGGVLTAHLTDDADHVVVTQVGPSSGSGFSIDLTVGSVTERYTGV